MFKRLIGLILISITLVACKKDVGDTIIMATLTEQDTTIMATSENVTEAESTTEETTKETLKSKYGIVTDEFSEEELAEILRLIGDEELFEEYFVNTINVGENWGGEEVEIAHKGEARAYATSFEIEEEYRFLILIGNDGGIYMRFTSEKIGFKTNVEGVTEIPKYALF